MKSFFFSLIACLFLASCSGSSSSSDSNGNHSENLSYDFTYNNCPTGSHSFSSKEALCAGLKDNNLNKSCAESLRRQFFKENNCPGQFDPPRTGPASPNPQTNSAPDRKPPRTNEGTQPSPAPVSPNSGIPASHPQGLSDARITLLMPKSSTDTVCAVEFSKSIVELNPLSQFPDLLFQVRAHIEHGSEIGGPFEDFPSRDLEILYNVNGTVHPQSIKGDSPTVRALLKSLNTGEEILISMAEVCKSYQGRPVTLVHGISRMNQTGRKISGNALLERYVFNERTNTCEVNSVLESLQKKMSPEKLQENELYIAPVFSSHYRRQWNEIHFREKTSGGTGYFSPNVKFDMSILHSIDIMNALEKGIPVRLTTSKKCLTPENVDLYLINSFDD